MGSWAHVAGLDAPPRQAARTPDSDNSTKSTAVVDTNAIVAGLQLHALAERIVTTADVLTEVRDARSREFLASLPFGLETLEPAPQSLAAVARFARATGDLQSLSDVDLRVLALTHTLEVQAIGSAHLRELPAQQAVQKKAVHANQGLPGWGDTGSTWAQLDKLNDEEEAKHGATGTANGVQELSVEASTGNAAEIKPTAAAEADQLGEDVWERAAKSRGAARQRRRKEQRHAQRKVLCQSRRVTEAQEGSCIPSNLAEPL